MPFIDVRIATDQVTDEAVKEVTTGITAIMSNILNKKRELVAVTVTAVDPRLWVISNQTMNNSTLTTAFVSASITSGKNTEQQKAEALQHIHDLLNHAIGPLNEASYIVITELPASNWGYDGKSQKSRQTEIMRNQNGSIDTSYYARRVHFQRAEFSIRIFKKVCQKLKSIWAVLVGHGDSSAEKIQATKTLQDFTI